MHETPRLTIALIAVAFVLVTTVTWADVTGPGTTGSEPTGEVPAPTVVPEPPPEEPPTPTTKVPEPKALEQAARDLGDREPKAAPKAKKPDHRSPKTDHGGAAGADWKAAKKAAKAECKERYTGRARGQCISAAAREHKNPKSRGRR